MEENGESGSSAPAEKKESGSMIKIVGVVVVLAILAFVIWEFGLKESSSGEQTVVQPSPRVTSNPEVEAGSTAAYKDGTYQAIGEYTNPASKEELDVVITIADGIITEASFTGTPDNPTTERMQGRVSEGLATEVVGKSIDEVDLDVVNGSSLTPQGFMDALGKIKAEAQS